MDLINRSTSCGFAGSIPNGRRIPRAKWRPTPLHCLEYKEESAWRSLRKICWQAACFSQASKGTRSARACPRRRTPCRHLLFSRNACPRRDLAGARETATSFPVRDDTKLPASASVIAVRLSFPDRFFFFQDDLLVG